MPAARPAPPASSSLPACRGWAELRALARPRQLHACRAPSSTCPKLIACLGRAELRRARDDPSTALPRAHPPAPSSSLRLGRVELRRARETSSTACSPRAQLHPPQAHCSAWVGLSCAARHPFTWLRPRLSPRRGARRPVAPTRAGRRPGLANAGDAGRNGHGDVHVVERKLMPFYEFANFLGEQRRAFFGSLRARATRILRRRSERRRLRAAPGL